MNKPIKHIKRMSAILVFTMTGFIIVILLVLLIYSPGTMKPFSNEIGKPMVGSISEKIYVNINGLEQGMIIKSKDETQPVLLYLHGGIPDFFLTHKYPTGLENHFTVVWWDRRGSGLTYSSDIPTEAITLEQLLSDTEEVTNYLRKRFGKDKIYLMGRSEGTFIGILAAARTPELYHVYIGVAQITNQLESEKLAYEYMLEQFRKKGNKNMVRKLESAPVTFEVGTSSIYLDLRDKAMHSLGIGTTHSMKSVVTGLFLPSLICPEYTLREKINLWRAKSGSGVSILWNTILVTDLTKQIRKIDIPVYFFHGIYDYTVSYDLAKDFFQQIEAPVKRFYTFYNSAHSPLFEEPVLVNEILLKDILNGTNNLSE